MNEDKKKNRGGGRGSGLGGPGGQVFVKIQKKKSGRGWGVESELGIRMGVIEEVKLM